MIQYDLLPLDDNVQPNIIRRLYEQRGEITQRFIINPDRSMNYTSEIQAMHPNSQPYFVERTGEFVRFTRHPIQRFYINNAPGRIIGKLDMSSLSFASATTDLASYRENLIASRIHDRVAVSRNVLPYIIPDLGAFCDVYDAAPIFTLLYLTEQVIRDCEATQSDLDIVGVAPPNIVDVDLSTIGGVMAYNQCLGRPNHIFIIRREWTLENIIALSVGLGGSRCLQQPLGGQQPFGGHGLLSMVYPEYTIVVIHQQLPAPPAAGQQNVPPPLWVWDVPDVVHFRQARQQLADFLRQPDAQARGFVRACGIMYYRFTFRNTRPLVPYVPLPQPAPFQCYANWVGGGVNVGRNWQVVTSAQGDFVNVNEPWIAGLRGAQPIPALALQQIQARIDAQTAAAHAADQRNAARVYNQQNVVVRAFIETSTLECGGTTIPVFVQSNFIWWVLNLDRTSDWANKLEMPELDVLRNLPDNLDINIGMVIAMFMSVGVSSWLHKMNITGRLMARVYHAPGPIPMLARVWNDYTNQPDDDIQPIYSAMVSGIMQMTNMIIKPEVFWTAQWSHRDHVGINNNNHAWGRFPYVPYPINPLSLGNILTNLFDIWGVVIYGASANFNAELVVYATGQEGGLYPYLGDSKLQNAASTQTPWYNQPYSSLVINYVTSAREPAVNIPLSFITWGESQTGLQPIRNFLPAGYPVPVLDDLFMYPIGEIITYDWLSQTIRAPVILNANMPAGMLSWLRVLHGTIILNAGIRLAGVVNAPIFNTNNPFRRAKSSIVARTSRRPEN